MLTYFKWITTAKKSPLRYTCINLPDDLCHPSCRWGGIQSPVSDTIERAWRRDGELRKRTTFFAWSQGWRNWHHSKREEILTQYLTMESKKQECKLFSVNKSLDNEFIKKTGEIHYSKEISLGIFLHRRYFHEMV